MAKSVRAPNAELVTAEILVDGSRLPDTVLVSNIEVTREVNRIPTARVIVADGDPSTETFKVSESDMLTPGKKIEINLGYHAKNETVFQGIILRQTLQVGPTGESSLVVGCSDKAIKLTVARTSQNFLEMSDSSAMSKVLESAGLEADVASISGEQEHILQSQSSDWDFLLARAEANGRVVLVDNGKVSIAKPSFSSAEYEVSFGNSLTEMNLELDAVTQLPAVKAASWDPKSQKATESSASEPSVNSQGDLTGKKLAEVLGVTDFELQTIRELEEASLKDWADAQLLKSRLSRIRGRVSFPGNAKVLPGKLLELKGIGKRFNGSGYVSGITHEMGDGTWTTEATFGLHRRWFADTHRDTSSAAAAGYTSGVSGLQIAKVLQVYEDPKNEMRIKVKLPLSSPDEGIWVRIASPYAGNSMGITFLPEVDDEVVLGFLNADPNAPIILGALHSSGRPAPFTPDEKNTEKSIVTRSGLKIGFDDEKKVLTILTPGGHVVTMSDEDKSVTVVDSNSNSLKMSEEGVSLTTPKDMTISADGNVSISGDTGVSIKSDASVSVDGGTVSLSAETEFSATGSASASLTSSGSTSVSGTMVEIN